MVENPWNVLHVTANHEKRVAQHLTTRAVEHYLPLYKERSRWTDRTVQLERPLFPGYVFIRFPAEQRLQVISTPGVIHLLGGAGRDIVSADELERIRLGLANGYLLRPHPWLEVGTNVRVRGGVFNGIGGIVTELRRECKVIIALSAVQQCFSLEIGMDELEVVGPQPQAVAVPRETRIIPSRT